MRLLVTQKDRAAKKTKHDSYDFTVRLRPAKKKKKSFRPRTGPASFVPSEGTSAYMRLRG